MPPGHQMDGLCPPVEPWSTTPSGGGTGPVTRSAAVAAVVRSVQREPSHHLSNEESCESGYHPAGKLAISPL